MLNFFKNYKIFQHVLKYYPKIRTQILCYQAFSKIYKILSKHSPTMVDITLLVEDDVVVWRLCSYCAEDHCED